MLYGTRTQSFFRGRSSRAPSLGSRASPPALRSPRIRAMFRSPSVRRFASPSRVGKSIFGRASRGPVACFAGAGSAPAWRCAHRRRRELGLLLFVRRAGGYGLPPHRPYLTHLLQRNRRVAGWRMLEIVALRSSAGGDWSVRVLGLRRSRLGRTGPRGAVRFGRGCRGSLDGRCRITRACSRPV